MENQENMQNSNPATGEKTFSQDDVNRIIQDRLAKEKNKGESDFAKKEQELAQREIRLSAKELLSESGLPVQLIDALNCTSKESLEKSISIIEEVFNQKQTEASKRIFKGVVPGQGRDEADELVDTDLRKVMGLQ